MCPMKKIGVIGCWLFAFLSCSERSAVNFQLLGTWRIENPSGQAFVRFQNQGKVVFYANRFRLEHDSLQEYGQWTYKTPQPQSLKDTIRIKITTKKGAMELKFLMESPDRLKQFKQKGSVYYNRMNED